jgi:hypothetical protein
VAGRTGWARRQSWPPAGSASSASQTTRQRTAHATGRHPHPASSVATHPHRVPSCPLQCLQGHLSTSGRLNLPLVEVLTLAPPGEALATASLMADAPTDPASLEFQSALFNTALELQLEEEKTGSSAEAFKIVQQRHEAAGMPTFNLNTTDKVSLDKLRELCDGVARACPCPKLLTPRPCLLMV